MPAPPVAAFVAVTAVTIAVIDPAVESNVRTPVAGMPEKYGAFRAPISGGPQVIRLRGGHPRARHPVVVLDIVAPGPVTGGPYVSVVGNRGLVVDRQFGRRNADRNIHRHLRD